MTFITEIFQTISTLFPNPNNPYGSFCSDMPLKGGWCLQDSASLINDSACFYVDIIHRNQELFQISREDYCLIHSKLRKDELQYPHSCYPKNVRRWMQGTVSRKKKCRVQFCTLLYCWAIGWGKTGIEYENCQQELKRICRLYFPAISDDMPLLPMLWTAMEMDYRNK